MQDFPTRLRDGYAGFVARQSRADRQRYRDLAERGQHPHTLVISCSDSRVAPETIFGCEPGELFVVRNVANLVPPFEPDASYHGTSAALEFAVTRLGVQAILVMGHAGCGGVEAALATDATDATDSIFIGAWIGGVRALAEAQADNTAPAPERHTRLEQASIAHSLANLRSFPFVSERIDRGQLSLHGAWFDIATGELWVTGTDAGSFARLSEDIRAAR
jgi:carbonic anhydrase